ncbi:cadherin-related family member 3 [Hemicordylus capensis]|uniref:cadherin-related family member 3 n=1 Tax=Hemicordylus capensis TaxID=884348 RepID=UPI0023046524|nr:cadherin-related family member 3 [Hemicordylus capensis]
MQNMLALCLILLLGEISGGSTLNFVGLPSAGKVTELSPSGTVVYTFSVNLSPSNATVDTGYPVIINSNPLTEAFRINPESTLMYKVVTTGRPILDYETMPHQFDLQIFVKDTAGANDLQILTVEILDANEPPVFRGNMANQTVVIYMLEEKEGVIYQIHATDYENGTSTRLAYSLASPARDLFFVSPTGTLSNLKKFDYETDPRFYILNITATDHLGLNTTRTVIVNIININDEWPYFITEKRDFQIEEESKPGTIVATIKAKDPDDVYISSLRYSLSPPEVIPNFSIDPVTGEIQVAAIIDRDTGPFRNQPNVTLVIRVVDSPDGGRSNQTTIVITIKDKNDNPPTCTKYNFRTEIYETNNTGTIIIDLKNFCEDVDAESPNNLFNFTGLSGVGSNKFTQDPPGSGRIKLIGNLDLENAADGAALCEYILNIVVQDIVPPNFPNNLYIYIRVLPVNEFEPVFSSPLYVFNVSEIEATDSNIGIVNATDKDFSYSKISYSIVAGGGTLYYSEVFWIDPIEGIVKNVAKLDYETKKKYLLTVQASDNEGRSSTVSVTVNVLEANDEKPICSPNSYLLEVPVDQQFGTIIEGFSIECVDRDSSPRSFRYSINSGNVNNHFTFSPSAGSNVSWLLLTSPFDYERGRDTMWIYRLKVFITDDNLLSTTERTAALIQTGTVTLTIKVIPNPTTVVPTTPGVTLVTSKENVYFVSAWYVPFIICLGSFLLLGVLGYLIYLLAKYIRTHCPPKPKADKKPLIKKPEKKKAKKEVVWELTNLNPIFDGEARDPVTGKLYEFNSKSGARRWKDTNEPPLSETKEPTAQATTTTTTTTTTNTRSGQANLSKKEAETRKQGGQNNMAPKPSEKKTEISDHNSNLKLQKPKEEPPSKGSSSPIPTHGSPVLSPKIYPQIPNYSY